LEFISASDSAKRGITKYVSDHTQGPAASISAAPGTLYRNYYVPHVVDGVPYEGQLEAQINLLESVPLVPVKNGYVRFDPVTIVNLHENATFDWKAAVNKVQVGLQVNTQVTSGEKTHRLEMCTDDQQVVSQMFSAAMDLGGWGNPSDDPLVIKAACMMLEASYKATILAAKINAAQTQNARCFLTLMGGGVFGNKPNWIVDAILLQKKEIIESGVDFYLVLFNGENELNQQSFGRIEQFAKSTGGTVKYIY
jgi:hypothetical protein